MSEDKFQFDNPELEAHFQSEMADGLEAYELRRMLREARIHKIQEQNNCSPREAAAIWRESREADIRHVQETLKSDRGIDCPRSDAEAIVRKAEQDQAQDLLAQLEAAQAASDKPGRKSGCLGMALSLTGVIAAAIFCVIQVGVVLGIQ